MSTRTPTLRAWVAGLVECTAALVEHLALGLDLVADAIAPHHEGDGDEPDGEQQSASWRVVLDGDHVHALPTDDAVEHTLTDDCLCGPTMRVSMTGRGDVWHIRHHRLDTRRTR